MFKILITLLSVVACAQCATTIPSGLVPQLDGRIVNGEKATISEFPWQISMQRSGRHFCGGSILNSKIIVTAAHCLHSAIASTIKVRAGSTFWNSGGMFVQVAKFKIHDDYNPYTQLNDIAVMLLENELRFTPTIKPIELTTVAPDDNAAAVVSGWGTTASGAMSIPLPLLKVYMQIVSTTTCASSIYGYGSMIKKGMICTFTKDKDSCQGDSGGPLVSNGVLVGVVSWGISCATPKFPGVYSDVAYFNEWIKSNAESIHSENGNN